MLLFARYRGPRPQPLQAVPGVHPHPDVGGAAGAADRAVVGRQHVTASARKVGRILHGAVQDSVRRKRF